MWLTCFKNKRLLKSHLYSAWPFTKYLWGLRKTWWSIRQNVTLHSQTDKANIMVWYKGAKDFILFHQSHSHFLYLSIEYVKMLGKLFIFSLLFLVSLSVIGKAWFFTDSLTDSSFCFLLCICHFAPTFFHAETEQIQSDYPQKAKSIHVPPPG